MKFVKIFLIIVSISNILSAQMNADAYYDVLDNHYRQNSNKTQSAFLIDEYKEYLILFPNSKQEDEALFTLSQLYKTNNDIPAELFTLIKLRIIHPQSPLRIKASQIIDSLVVYHNQLLLTSENEKAIKEINNMTLQKNHQLAYLELLSFLHFAEIKVLDKLFIDEIRTYKILYGKNSDNLDAINYWQACAYKRRGNLNAALLYYKKVTDIFHDSKFIAPALFQMSELYQKTNRQNKATDCLIELINQYPDAPETGDAQYALAQLYHYHYKDLKEALTNYKLLAQAFPENHNFNDALINAAKISESMGNYADALNSYMMIVENNKISDGTQEALKNILRINLDILKDYSQAAQTYILLAQMYPEHKNAPQNLLNAARLYKNTLNDPAKANEILGIIMTSYKDTPTAAEAEKMLKE